MINALVNVVYFACQLCFHLFLSYLRTPLKLLIMLKLISLYFMFTKVCIDRTHSYAMGVLSNFPEQKIMSTALNIQSLEQKLNTLEPGHRTWFSWKVPNQGEGIPFEIIPFSDKAANDKLEDIIEAGARDDREVKVGILMVSSLGRLHLLSSSMKRYDLQCLALLCTHFAKQHPNLGTFKDACIDLVNADGVLENRIESPDDWADLKKVYPKGSTNHIAAQINKKLKIDQDSFIWVSGGDKAVGYTIFPVSKDAKGERFQSRVTALQKVYKNNPYAFRGILRKKSEDSVVISTETDLHYAENVLSFLYRNDTHDFQPKEILLIQVTSGKVTDHKVLRKSEMQSSGSTDLRLLNEISGYIDTFKSGEKVAYWFQSGKLILASDTAQLRQKVAEESKDRPFSVGTLSMSSKGFPVFSSKKNFPEFIERLAEWVALQYQSCPNLCHLKGARFMCRAKDGTVTDKQRSETAWSVVPNPST